jgi:hypothetical protein
MTKDKAAEEPTKQEAEAVAEDETEVPAEVAEAQKEKADLAQANIEEATKREEESLERIRQQGHT